MSSNGLQWLAFSLYALMFIPVTIAEVVWMVRRGWCMPARGIAFSLASGGIGMALSSAVIFVAALVMFMLVMGPSGTGSDTPEAVYIVILVLALSLPILLITGVKVVFLRWMKIRTGREAAVFSFVASAALLLCVFIIPTITLYFLS